MKQISRVLFLAFWVFILFAGSHRWSLQGNKLPALFGFLSPFEGIYANAESRWKDQKIYLEGAEDEVKIIFDERHVPHIYAQSLSDALLAQGYLHAKDRLFQTDLSRRATQGRLAELIGDRLLSRDSTAIRLGLTETIQQTADLWKSQGQSFELLEDYCKGYNHFVHQLKSRQYPLEYKLISAAPSAWSVKDVIAVLKSMQLVLAFRAEEIPLTNSMNLLGDSLFQVYHQQWNPKTIPIIPDQNIWKSWNSEASRSTEHKALGHLDPLWDEYSAQGVGSNNWVVAGKKSKTGAPLLANDPHLRLTLPSVWYELHIHTPDFNAYGVSLPGIPGIIIGFNDDIAWGMTNVGQDVTDWYEITWADEEKNSYILDSQKMDVEWKEYDIPKKDGSTETWRFPHSTWGPIYDDRPGAKTSLALKWIGNHVATGVDEMSVFLKLMSVDNQKDKDLLLQNFITPAQNFVYADKKGNIGLNVSGKLPIKRPAQGRLIQDGSRSSSDWSGYVPTSHRAQASNPEQGFLASANQRSTSEAYPYHYGGGFDDYRGRTINRYLQADDLFDVTDMKSFQLSNYSIWADEAKTKFLALLDESQLESSLQKSADMLANWDAKFDREDQAPILFELWYEQFFELCFDEYTGKHLQKPEDWMFVSLLDSPSDLIFDVKETENVESANDLALLSFRIANAKYDELLEEKKDYGEYKAFGIPHLMGIGSLGRLNLYASGHWSALNSLREASSVAPSWRMIVDMRDGQAAEGIFPGGPSGNPGSPFYDNTVDDWVEGNYYELQTASDPDQIENVSHSITLIPR